jgi:hypothetical protein
MTSSFTATRQQVLDQFQANVAGLDTLGHITTHSLSGIAPVADIDALLQQSGLGHIKLTKIRTRSAIQRALWEFIEQGGGNLTADGVSLDLAFDDPERAVFLVVGKYIDRAAEDARFQTEWRVTYHKKDTSDYPLTFSSPEVEQVVRPLVERFHQSYSAADTTFAVVHRVLKYECQAASLRRNGGVYFVPSQYSDKLQALERFINSYAELTGRPCYLSLFPVPDTENAKAHMQRHAHETLLARLGEAQHQLDLLTQDTRRDKVKPETLEKRLREVRHIYGQAELYRDLLALEANDVTAQLDTLQAAFKAMMHSGAPAFTPSSSAIREALAQAQQAQQGQQEQPSAPSESGVRKFTTAPF